MASQGRTERGSIGASGDDVLSAAGERAYFKWRDEVPDYRRGRPEAQHGFLAGYAAASPGGRTAEFWRDDALTTAAEIVRRWFGTEEGGPCARDIEQLLSCPAEHGAHSPSAASAGKDTRDEPLLAPVVDREEELGSSVGRADRGSTDWRTIDSAPKDGTHVLITWRSGRVSVGFWSANEVWQSYPGTRYGAPTHWMPLPSGPFDPVRAGADAPSNGEGGVA